MRHHSVAGYIACLEDALKYLKAAQEVMDARDGVSQAHCLVARELVVRAVAETRTYDFKNLWRESND